MLQNSIFISPSLYWRCVVDKIQSTEQSTILKKQNSVHFREWKKLQLGINNLFCSRVNLTVELIFNGNRNKLSF